ncbi:uncharacterized protein EI90DRAFT_3153428 [Cantharellus anzutake]|uniref:uncharacterized protein n=1 Tax=Cantharellus anzutake TaxID=1750568 RepID=UPI0019035274|nr:uncharacterized protein EI90DRAFT_3153428 [Cantharellus anzutake]KAF8334054.1 hypothetical protein EI90DRAFT_3153428 [Cantharellus anzutake]
MGTTSSKVARQLPLTKPRPAWAGARTPRPEEAEIPAARYGVNDPKSQAIKEDTKDPQLVQSLYTLGQVDVNRMSVQHDSHRKAGAISQMFRSREESEFQALSDQITPNRLAASSLFELLDARKGVKTHTQLHNTAKAHSIDPALLDTLARFVNTPSTGESTTTHTVENGEERTTSQALWVDPKIVS